MTQLVRDGVMHAGQGATAWYQLDTAMALATLGTALNQGLAHAEVARRLHEEGANSLPQANLRSPLRMLVDQFADLMVLVLLAAALVAGIAGEPQDTLAIFAIVLLNAGLGFAQEYRAEREVASLRALAAPTARVRRDGQVTSVRAEGLVRGDVVLLEAGDIVPADLRLLEVHGLQVDEATLTGESVPTHKETASIPGPVPSLGDRRNMAFKGTTVTYGRAEALVVATGPATELGKVASLLEQAEETRTPLQRRLRAFAAQLAVAVVAICAVIFTIGLGRGEPPLLMFLTAVSLAVAAMPEALPAVVTMALALGARRMAHRQALVRHLPAVETLGSVTYICADKTGTLTGNRMSVQEVRRPPAWRDGPAVSPEPDQDPLLRVMALNSDAIVHADGRITGEPTEVALMRHVLGLVDVARLIGTFPRVSELPFSSERGRMTTRHLEVRGSHVLLMKGAPERVIGHCATQANGRDVMPLDEKRAHATAHEMARAGLRVMAFAIREEAGALLPLAEENERDFTLLGMVGLLDAPREEAVAAVAECARAGIHVVMVTGDHPETADAVASAVGIRTPSTPHAMTGAALDRLDDQALQARSAHARVYARVAPEHKIRIVKALQSRGEFVAMTGDGVNDAPALRQADIGVAMGKGGTDVAREASDLVLLDDNFASIVAAVGEGRRIYDNIRRFIRYILTGNSAEIWLIFLAPLVGLPLPLLPIHILWINLVTDGLPGLALALEPAERAVMQRAPRPTDESVFAHGLWQHALWVGLLMGGVSLLTQGWSVHAGHDHWQSMTFTVLALSQLGHVLAVRSERESLFSLGLWSNPVLAVTVAGTAMLQLLTLYVPALNTIFRTQPLTLPELAACVAMSLVVFLAVEVEKSLVRRGVLYRDRSPHPA